MASGARSHPTEVARLFDDAERLVGELDITEEDYDRIFDTNAKSVFFTLQEATRRLNDGGRIIVSSTGGTKMFAAVAMFLASEAAAG